MYNHHQYIVSEHFCFQHCQGKPPYPISDYCPFPLLQPMPTTNLFSVLLDLSIWDTSYKWNSPWQGLAKVGLYLWICEIQNLFLYYLLIIVLFSIRITVNLLFLIPVHGLCSWLLLLSIMFLRFIHVVVCIISLSFLWLNISLYEHTHFVYPVIYWWTFDLFLSYSLCEQSSSEYLCISFWVSVFNSLG